MTVLDFLIGNSIINFICVLLIFSVTLYNYKYLYSEKERGTGYLVLWFVLTIYSVFYSPTHSDNYASLESYNEYLSGVDENYLHFESLYFRIMDYLPYGYVAWRLVIWGVGSLLLVLYVKWMEFDVHVATIALLFFTLPLLFYQRAIIGYVLLYFGLSMLIKQINEHGKLLIQPRLLLFAIICIAAALPFHNSMPFYVLIIIASFFLPHNRTLFIICLIASIVLSGTNLGTLFLSYTSEDTQRTAEYYLEDAKVGKSANLFGFIEQVFMYAPYYVMLAYCAWNINSGKLRFTSYEKVILTNAMLLILVSFAYSTTSFVIQGKFYTASLLPWGLFLTSFYSRNKYNEVARNFAKWSLYAFLGLLLIRISSGSIMSVI